MGWPTPDMLVMLSHLDLSHQDVLKVLMRGWGSPGWPSRRKGHNAASRGS